MERELLTRDEVCEMLGIRYGTLRKFVKYYQMPYVDWDFGKKRFLKSSILKWLKQHETTEKPEEKEPEKCL